MSDRYQLSVRAGAAVATSVLQDLELATNDNRSLVIDHQKLRRKGAMSKRDKKKRTRKFQLCPWTFILMAGKMERKQFWKGPMENIIDQSNGRSIIH